MKELIQSKKFILVASLTGILVLMLLSFALGLKVGMKKGLFSCNWGENYQRNFMPPMPDDRRGFFPDFSDRGLRNGHGIFGIVIAVNDNNIIVKDREDRENTVNVSSQTDILSRADKLSLKDIKIGDRLIIIGRPGDQGAVNADFIRIFFSEENNQ